MEHERHMEAVKLLSEISSWKGLCRDLLIALGNIRDEAYLAETGGISGDKSNEELLEFIYQYAKESVFEWNDES